MAQSRSLAGEFAINLLRKFDQTTVVRLFLISQWKETSEYGRRMRLIWRLLDDEQLEMTLHEDIYAFVKDNFKQFIQEIIRWYGSENAVLSGCRTRLADPTFPTTKAWVYLCSAMASADKEAVGILLSQYRTSDDPFTARVANELLDS